MFERESVVRRVIGEGSLLAGGGRALLIQVADPNVARGVAEHSNFAEQPLKRLFGTLRGTYPIVFGDDQLAERVAGRVRSIHDHIVGSEYRANDPQNLLWVHATLVDTSVLVYNWLARKPLTINETEEFYQQMKIAAEMFGCPLEEQPDSWDDFKSWFDGKVKTLEIIPEARAIAAALWDKTNLPMAVRPLMPMAHLCAVGLLPGELREQYGEEWSISDQRKLDRFASIARPINRFTPHLIRESPARFITMAAERSFR